MNGPKLLSKVEQLIGPILDEQGYELVAIEFAKESQGLTLRIFIDSENSITVDDCASVSEQVGLVLDKGDAIKKHYILEVSSPGIERPLARKKDFEEHKGSKIYVKTIAPVSERKRFTGILKTADEDSFTIDCEGEVFNIPYDKVTKAHLIVNDIFS